MTDGRVRLPWWEKVADGTYQFTASMSTNNKNWRVLLELYSDLNWNKTGVELISLTGSAAGRFTIDPNNRLYGKDEKADPFQPGNYRFVITKVVGGVSLDITKISSFEDVL